jgi:hypothetical protein
MEHLLYRDVLRRQGELMLILNSESRGSNEKKLSSQPDEQ